MTKSHHYSQTKKKKEEEELVGFIEKKKNVVIKNEGMTKKWVMTRKRLHCQRENKN